MRKLVVTALIFLSCGMAYALPLGNPMEASLFTNGILSRPDCCNSHDPFLRWEKKWSFRVGFYGDYVFDRKMENDFQDNDRDIENFQINTSAGYLAFNLFNRIDLFGTLGATQINILATDIAFGQAINIGTEVHLRTDFSWSVGSRITLLRWKGFGVGIEGQYFQTNPRLEYAVFDNSSLIRYFGSNRSTCYSDWQVGVGLAYHLQTDSSFDLIPYIGAKWSESRLKTKDPLITGTPSQRVRDQKSKKLWGWAIGTTLTLCDCIGMTVEGRFADETAIYVNGEFRF